MDNSDYDMTIPNPNRPQKDKKTHLDYLEWTLDYAKSAHAALDDGEIADAETRELLSEIGKAVLALVINHGKVA